MISEERLKRIREWTKDGCKTYPETTTELLDEIERLKEFNRELIETARLEDYGDNVVYYLDNVINKWEGK